MAALLYTHEEAEFTVSAAQIRANTAVMSRLEARLALETAVECRFHRMAAKKPVLGGRPVDLLYLHQAILQRGGYRKVSLASSCWGQEEVEGCEISWRKLQGRAGWEKRGAGAE